MITGTTEKKITLKSGKIVPSGTKVTIEIGSRNPRICVVKSDAITFKAGTAACLVLIGKKVPSTKKLERWVSNGYSKTPNGDIVEIDGYNSEGCPSWLKILGIV